MRITNYEGNLLNSGAQVILHQVNCQGVMGSGVAKAIREKWPQVYTSYQEFCSLRNPSDLLGKVQIVGVEDNKVVANLFGQGMYGYDGHRYTSYDAVYSGLENLRETCLSGRFTSIALPWHMCSDRGGADWTVILSMISSVFKETEIDIEIWKL